jgi:dCTP deaminase
MIDEFDPETGSENTLKTLYGRQYIPMGRGIVIHPHQFILATTLEYIRLPYDLMSYVVGRSTWGRLGLIVATAIGIHSLFAGSLTLELRNLGETPLKLYPGEAIAQLFFHSTREGEEGGIVTDVATGVSQYSGTVDMVPRRISSSVTHRKLLALRQRNNQ